MLPLESDGSELHKHFDGALHLAFQETRDLCMSHKRHTGNSTPTHAFFANPSPIFMKFGKLGGQQKKLINTKFQLISPLFME